MLLKLKIQKSQKVPKGLTKMSEKVKIYNWTLIICKFQKKSKNFSNEYCKNYFKELLFHILHFDRNLL